MRLLADRAPIIRLDSVGSTQAHAANVLASGAPVGAVQALHQTDGRGRFGRPWHSPRGECLAASFVLESFADHPYPYLLGMAMAVAAARAFSCRVQWPNDLVMGGRKLGGVLSEVVKAPNGSHVPIVGIGVNLNQTQFPDELHDRATSLRLLGSVPVEPDQALKALVEAAAQLPEPWDWSALEPYWMELDETPGKRYRLFSGAEVVATGLGRLGELLYEAEGEIGSVLAADALLG